MPLNRSPDPDEHPSEQKADDNLDALRERIRQVDLELVQKAAERVELARQVGEIKRRQNLPTVDYIQERVVVERARMMARERGLDPGMAEDLFAALILSAVTAQDRDNLRRAAVGTGKSAVIVGGAGRMGRWMREFLSAQGFTAGILDPAAEKDENDWARETLPSAELVVCSTPPAATAELYTRWTEKPPEGVVVDIASIKTPLIGPIDALQGAGGSVASIHPLFGPSIDLLRETDVVICDTGDSEAAAAVEKLFEPTTAHIVHLPLAEHDRIMADLLSLGHAAAIAFALALPETEHPVRSTTFRALESIAAAVVRESPDVYYEIQTSNPHATGAYDRLRTALERIVSVIIAEDKEGFHALLEEGRRRTPSDEASRP